jgi:RimJ/RimL family protein N-acetyltransferase
MEFKRRSPLKREQYAVYRLGKRWKSDPLTTRDAQSVWATQDAVAGLFRQESHLERRFQEFLNRDCWGVFQVLDNQWASYAWMTTAGHPGPAHMPAASQSASFWIFHCRTKQAYQGQGLYKRSLRMLARAARQHLPEAALYIDTEVDNLPSRKAIVSVGFEPYGLVNTWTLTVPRLKSWTFARWHQRQPPSTAESRAA